MCLAIARKPNAQVPDKTLENAFWTYRDGAGFAFAQNGKLIVEKGFFNLNEFMTEYSFVPRDCPALIHFRMATSGKVNTENCHPWHIDKRHAFIHNGWFTDFVKGELISDTGHFVRRVLRPMLRVDPDAWRKQWGKYVLDSIMINEHSKGAILDNQGNIEIYNEQAGHWEDGVWYSNRAYRWTGYFRSESEEELERLHEFYSG